MKTLFTLLLTLIVGYLPAQSRLGYNMGQVRADFSGKNWEYGTSESGYQWMAFQDDDIRAVYWFNEDGQCVITSCTPTSVGKLNMYVELYNKQFVIIDDYNWKWYSPEGIVIYVALRKTDDGTPVFFYTRKPWD